MLLVGLAAIPSNFSTFDDQSDPALARSIAEQIVADGRALIVIGHRTSPETVAAAPVYAAAKIPAITSTSTADSITANNPWYFRTVFDNHTQGLLIAAYAHDVLHADHLSIVAGNTDYGTSLAASIAEGFRPYGEVRNRLDVDMVGGRQQETLQAAVATAESQILIQDSSCSPCWQTRQHRPCRH